MNGRWIIPSGSKRFKSLTKPPPKLIATEGLTRLRNWWRMDEQQGLLDGFIENRIFVRCPTFKPFLFIHSFVSVWGRLRWQQAQVFFVVSITKQRQELRGF